MIPHHRSQFVIDLKQGTLVSLAFHFPASTSYVNSALAMLNARRHIKESGQGEAWTLGTGEDIPMQVSLHKESSAYAKQEDREEICVAI